MKTDRFFLKSPFAFLALLTSLTASLPQPAESAVVARFTNGEGTTSPDQYSGTAGDGWAGAWNRRVGSGGTTTITVQNSNPFSEGSGNYLQLVYTRTESGGSNRAGVARAFANNGPGSIDMTQPYTISFDFRPEVLTGWQTSADQIVFSSETTTTIGSPTANAPWALQIRADEGWLVFNGNGAGATSNLNFSSLGLTGLTLGEVYSIAVYIDPLQNGYDLTISVGDTTYRASELNNGQLLGFRTNAIAATANVLQFRMTSDNKNDSFQWSLDNIAVIPEPGSAGLALSGVGGLLFIGSRLFRTVSCLGSSLR